MRAVTLERSVLGNNDTASALTPLRGQGLPQDAYEFGVRRRGRRRTAEQHRVTRLEGDTEGVDRDVGGARFVDDADDAERDPQLSKLQSVGQGLAGDDLPDRVRQDRDLTQTVGDADDARGIETQAIEQARLGVRFLGTRDVLGVGCEDRLRGGLDGVGSREQDLVLVRRRQAAQRAGRRFRRPREPEDNLLGVGLAS